MFFLLIFLTLLFLCVYSIDKKTKLSFGKILLIAIAVRLLIMFLFFWSTSTDLDSFLRAGKIILEKKPDYFVLPSLVNSREHQVPFPIPYFPFFLYLGSLALYLKNLIDPLFFLKFLFTIFDIGIVWLIYLLARKKSLSLIYALNPITLINTNIHGQFDTLPLFFLLLGIYYATKRAGLLSTLALSLGILIKNWPALFIIPIIRQAKRKYIYLLVILLPLLSVLVHSLIFKTPILDIITPIKNYRGLYGYWGISEVLKPVKLLIPNLYLDFQQIVRRVFLISFLLFSLSYRFNNVIKAVTKLMLFFFAFTPTWGAQWLTWLVPFVVLTKPKYLSSFIITSTIYLAITFYGDVYKIPVNLIQVRDIAAHIIGLFVWFSVVLMFIKSWNFLKN